MLAVRTTPKYVFATTFSGTESITPPTFPVRLLDLNQVTRAPRAPLLSARRVLDKRAQGADEAHLVDRAGPGVQ
jgi:hypothetical protein